jgi:hypothetical protein
MPADIDAADPNRPARCPRRIVGEGPRCRALVLAGDADEHEGWHDRLDELLTSPVSVEDAGVSTVTWPARGAAAGDPAQL